MRKVHKYLGDIVTLGKNEGNLMITEIRGFQGKNKRIDWKISLRKIVKTCG